MEYPFFDGLTTDEYCSISLFMPKRDPFADKRKTLKGVKPKQAAKKIEQKRCRDTRRIPKASRELAALKSEAAQTEKQVAIQKQMLELMASAPTPSQQRKIILGIFQESGVNPIQIMIDSLPRDDDGRIVATSKDELSIVRDLAAYFAPKPKSIDLQAEVQGSLTINVTDFSKTTQTDLKSAADAAKAADPIYDISDSTEFDEPDYAEFEAPEATQTVAKNEDGTL